MMHGILNIKFKKHVLNVVVANLILRDGYAVGITCNRPDIRETVDSVCKRQLGSMGS
jgi:hypothetical protein